MKLFNITIDANDGQTTERHDVPVRAENEAAARAWLTAAQKELGVTIGILSVTDITPQPDNTVVEQDNGYYFPAWNMHVAKTTKVMKTTVQRSFLRKAKKITAEETVPVFGSVEEAKQHVLDIYGINVDKDPAPPKPQEQ